MGGLDRANPQENAGARWPDVINVSGECLSWFQQICLSGLGDEVNKWSPASSVVLRGVS